MKANDPFRKNVRFGIGVFFTVLEGLLSACVYMAIYLLLNMLLNNTVTIEHLNNLTFLIIGFFTVRLIAYGFGYTQGQIGGGAVSRQIRLYLGDPERSDEQLSQVGRSGKAAGRYGASAADAWDAEHGWNQQVPLQLERPCAQWSVRKGCHCPYCIGI